MIVTTKDFSRPPDRMTDGDCERTGTEKGIAMSTASDIVAGLGGRENITALEPCITRLRVEVTDQAKVDEEALRAAGAFGVVRSGRLVQVVVGPKAVTQATENASL